MADFVEIDRVKPSRYSLFVERIYSHMTCVEWLGHCSWKYNFYLILHDINIQDSIVFLQQCSYALSQPWEGIQSGEIDNSMNEGEFTIKGDLIYN